MSDYFNNLAARAIGRVDAVLPRLAARFERHERGDHGDEFDTRKFAW